MLAQTCSLTGLRVAHRSYCNLLVCANQVYTGRFVQRISQETVAEAKSEYEMNERCVEGEG